MGLSNEERYTKFFWSMKAWRAQVHEFASKLDDDRVSDTTLEKTRDVANSWVARLDRLVGLVLRKTNTNSAYWLMGERDNSFRDLMADEFTLRYSNPPEEEEQKEHVDSARWWLEQADMVHTVDHLHSSGFQPPPQGLMALARWWDFYNYFSAILYSVGRYDDNLFGNEVGDGLTQLMGEMVNRRFEVCFGSYGHAEAAKMETYLLLKNRAFHLLLDAEFKAKGPDYFDKPFDGRALWKRIAMYTRAELHDVFEKAQNEKWEWEREYNKKEAEKRAAAAPVNGLYGPPHPPKPKPEDPAPVAAQAKQKRKGKTK